jgi:hypothetical protein
VGRGKVPFKLAIHDALTTDTSPPAQIECARATNMRIDLAEQKMSEANEKFEKVLKLAGKELPPRAGFLRQRGESLAGVDQDVLHHKSSLTECSTSIKLIRPL